jgi:hypothetical protein
MIIGKSNNQHIARIQLRKDQAVKRARPQMPPTNPIWQERWSKNSKRR